MKLGETELTIAAYALGLQGAEAGNPATSLRRLADFLGDFRTCSMSELIARASKIPAPSTRAGGQVPDMMSADVIALLEKLGTTLKHREAISHASDLELLIKLLRRDSGYFLPMLETLRRALMPIPPEKEIREFIERLRAETGSDAFEDTLSKLAASRLKREHVVEIARAVYGGIPKNTSRKAAISYIRKPHDARTSAKRGIDAMGGRSAA